MTNKLQDRIDLFVANTASVKKEFLMPHALVKQLAALLYTAENRPVDAEYIRSCNNLIASSTGIFSSFRSNLAVALSAMLALSGNPETQMENTLTVYKLLKKAGFYGSDYLTVAAFEIAAKGDPRSYETTVQRARDFYKGMKRSHWWITGEDDYIYVALLALTDLSLDDGLAHVEALHKELKPHMRNANSVQALSQVMAVSSQPTTSASRILELRNATKNAGIRMDRQYTLSALGILAMLPGSAEEIAADIKETYDYLRKQRGFGLFTNPHQSLLLLASALVTIERAEAAGDTLVSGTLATNFSNIIIAECTAIVIIAVTASTTLATSSSSSN